MLILYKDQMVYGSVLSVVYAVSVRSFGPRGVFNQISTLQDGGNVRAVYSLFLMTFSLQQLKKKCPKTFHHAQICFEFCHHQRSYLSLYSFARSREELQSC